MPKKILVYVEPYDGYGDFAHFRDMVHWMSEKYKAPEYEIVPVCVMREDSPDIDAPNVERMLGEFEALGWDVEEKKERRTAHVKQCGNIIIADSPETLKLPDLEEYALAWAVSTETSFQGALTLLAQDDKFQGKIYLLREHGDRSDLALDLIPESRAERVGEFVDDNKIGWFTMGRTREEVGFLFHPQKETLPLKAISDDAFLAHLSMGANASMAKRADVEEALSALVVIPTYFQNDPKSYSPAMQEHGALLLFLSSIVAVLHSPIVGEMPASRTLCFVGSAQSTCVAEQFFDLLQTLLKDGEFDEKTSLGQIELVSKDASGKINVDARTFEGGGRTVRIISGFFLSYDDQAILLSNSEMFMGCSGDKSLEETMKSGALPLVQLRPYKKEVYESLLNDLDLLVERQEISTEQAEGLYSYLEAIIIAHGLLDKLRSFMPNTPEFRKTLTDIVKGLSPRLSPDIMHAWKCYTAFLVEKRNAFDVVEVESNEVLGIKSSEALLAQANAIKAPSVICSEAALDGSKQILKARDDRYQYCLVSAKQIKTHLQALSKIKPSNKDIDTLKSKLTALERDLTYCLDDIELYLAGLKTQAQFTFKNVSSSLQYRKDKKEFERQLQRVDKLLVTAEKSVVQFGALEGELIKFTSEGTETKDTETKSTALQKIFRMKLSYPTKGLTTDEFSSISQNGKVTIEALQKQYLPDLDSQTAQAFLSDHETTDFNPAPPPGR